MERLRLDARGLVFDTLAAGPLREGAGRAAARVPTDCRLLDRVVETLAPAALEDPPHVTCVPWLGLQCPDR